MPVKTPRPVPGLSLPARLRLSAPPERRALLTRLALVVATLSGEPPPAAPAALVDRFTELVAAADPSSVWLALAVLDGELPTSTDVRRTARAIRLEGVAAAFGAEPERILRGWLAGAQPMPDVSVAAGPAILVDVDHTARTDLATGIQRVTRETVRRWDRDHAVELVGWDADYRHLRRLQPAERHKALTGEGDVAAAAGTGVVVPWEATYVLPELAPERARNERIAALAHFARCRTGVIGFDCVPVTSAETTVVGVSEAFALNLAAVRHMTQLSTISSAAALEYGGWRSMLGSVGEQGPAITVDVLPAEVPDSTAEDLDAVRARLLVADLPLVLCVGTHEPRKNHLALLHAAELLWRDGVDFSLIFVGGRSWHDAGFQAALAAARTENRPVDTVSTLSDRELWAAYRIAHCTVFPSLNEGFGLPVAESLACGTPVVTSRYGSMSEIAAEGGALLVDPRDDRDIASGLRALLTDEQLHGRLHAEASARSRRTWDDYARDTWGSLVG